MNATSSGASAPLRVLLAPFGSEGDVTPFLWLADRLVDKTLISRDGHANDRRMQTLSLTAAGRDKVPALAALADRNDAEYFGVLGDEERAALGRLLRTLADRRGLKTVPVD